MQVDVDQPRKRINAPMFYVRRQSESQGPALNLYLETTPNVSDCDIAPPNG
jgi:hypothetical protein